ncbi:LuxR family transcriptional regulator [Candidatus Terasakiella magnetica]|uniref:LuxR family transcriptional regulator n=1 Tax=Candidatus Terasakiella magnetica TaxID=1867952 RepID=A0A1C3RC75_9PROT|nr:response regulator transcription factor [Candidatus Terasakiella magnetica]SCA54848.1 LuxR family transcriptional regulator [Candidatus Terasakiella magnetica]
MDNNSQKIRVLLVDDHPLVLDGIRSRLEDDGHIDVIAEASNGEEALHLAGEHKPDIVLMDINMPVMNGIEAAEKFSAELPDIRLLMLTMHDSREYITRVLKAGAKGYILKDVSSNEMISAIKAVYEGKTYYSSGVTDILVNEGTNKQVPLTDREKTILQLLAEGNSNKHVARELDISVRTVETHRRNIKRKLSVKTSAGLVKYAIENGIVEL